MNREPGYYWVKLQPTDKEMHVAKWTGKYWLLHGETFTIGDRSFHEIHPNQIKVNSKRDGVIGLATSNLDSIDVMFATIITAAVAVLIYFIFS